MLCLTKGNNWKITSGQRGHGDTEKPPGQGAVWLRGGRGDQHACWGNIIPFAPHTGWSATAPDKELLLPLLLKLEGKASTGDAPALKRAGQGSPRLMGQDGHALQ